MKISGLRIERSNGKSFLTADIECKFSKETKLWFCVSSEYEDMLTDDVYDAYLIAALYPAMYYNEPIEVDGFVSEKLYKNVVSYAINVINQFSQKIGYQLNKVPVHIKGTKVTHKNQTLHIGTGFSGGIDSFATIYDRYEKEKNNSWRIDSLFFFNIGQNGAIDNPNTEKCVETRYQLNEMVANELKVNSIMMDSNLFKFYLPHWEYDAGTLCRIAAILVFQRALQRYYISSSFSYLETADIGIHSHSLCQFSELYITPMLSSEGIDILVDGSQYSRTQKTALIADYPLAQKYLNVCINVKEAAKGQKNCSYCSKCLRTLLALESLKALGKFSNVFDLDIYRKHAFKYKCEQRILYRSNPFARDNVDFARTHNVKIPCYILAWIVMFPQLSSQWGRKVLKRLIGKNNIERMKKKLNRC